MTEFEQKLWKFEVALKDAIKRLGELKADNQELTAKNQHLEDQIESQKNIIKDLEENNKRVKLAETMSHSQNDQSELKKQIDGYVKEIDRCIALLNG